MDGEGKGANKIAQERTGKYLVKNDLWNKIFKFWYIIYKPMKP